MLRIHVEHGPGRAYMRLEGKLVGPWVKELLRCWECALTRCTADEVTLDLDEVTFVDSEGQLLLAAMHKAGARLQARGALSRFIVERIQASNVVINQCAAAEFIEGEGV